MGSNELHNLIYLRTTTCTKQGFQFLRVCSQQPDITSPSSTLKHLRMHGERIKLTPTLRTRPGSTGARLWTKGTYSLTVCCSDLQKREPAVSRLCWWTTPQLGRYSYLLITWPHNSELWYCWFGTRQPSGLADVLSTEPVVDIGAGEPSLGMLVVLVPCLSRGSESWARTGERHQLELGTGWSLESTLQCVSWTLHL